MPLHCQVSRYSEQTPGLPVRPHTARCSGHGSAWP